MQVIPLIYQRKSLKNNSKKPRRVVYSSVFRLLKYFFYLLGGGTVGGFKEVTVYVRRGAGSRVTRSTCHRYDRHACGDLHRDIRMSKAVNGAFFKTCRVTNLFHPHIYRTWVNISAVFADK